MLITNLYPKMVTVVLTKYKRLHLFEEQLKSIQNQSINVDEILVCDNTVVNKGVWDRFNLAKKATNEFICIVDDDTIPGSRWIENCLNEFNKEPALYGTCGYIFHSSKKYKGNYRRIGWVNSNVNKVEVDYVVHNWFFKRDWLEYFWRIDSIPFNFGEDINLSFQLQKEGIKTYVPPHPKNDTSLWGSLKGKQYGDDDKSLWISNPLNFKRNLFDYFSKKVNEGWILLCDSSLI